MNDPSSVLHYPPELSEWWRARADAARLPLARLAAEAGRLSDRFTTDRPAAFDAYLAPPEARLAYGWFFFPQTWVRARFPLAEAVDFRGWALPSGRALRVVDVGAGQGAAGLSVSQWALARGLAPSVALTAVDRSPEALRDLVDLHRDLPGAVGHVALDVVTRDVVDPAAVADAVASADLVVAAFAANEVVGDAGPAAAAAWLAGLVPPSGLLLVLEPATRTASLRLDAAVAQLASAGRAHAWGPDLRPRSHDPSSRHWPYESRRWRAPPTVERVNATLWRSLREVTFSYAALAAVPPPALPSTPGLHRLLSPVRRQKGLASWAGRASDGKAYDYEVLLRHVPAERQGELEAIERGDVLTLSEWTEGAGHRVRLPSLAAIASRYHPR